MKVEAFISKINTLIVNPTIKLLFAGAVLFFLWGVFKYVKGADDESARSEGAQHMLWGIIGMFIMVAVFGIMKIILRTFGIEVPEGIGR